MNRVELVDLGTADKCSRQGNVVILGEGFEFLRSLRVKIPLGILGYDLLEGERRVFRVLFIIKIDERLRIERIIGEGMFGKEAGGVFVIGEGFIEINTEAEAFVHAGVHFAEHIQTGWSLFCFGIQQVDPAEIARPFEPVLP
ncbi:MAG TPA: hypothetical protein VLR45_10595 [Desulfoprunum sp.]|nr:hypothetical protein [Desulfoprunum sp.]